MPGEEGELAGRSDQDSVVDQGGEGDLEGEDQGDHHDDQPDQ